MIQFLFLRSFMDTVQLSKRCKNTLLNVFTQLSSLVGYTAHQSFAQLKNKTIFYKIHCHFRTPDW